MTIHEAYMHRCLELAQRGAGYVAPNPMVGAVLVHEEGIIGEGYHGEFGGPHAEVNCLESVAEKNRVKISQAVLYVSLEPCAHYGKTPPCTDLIIKNKIPQVVIGCHDPFKEVSGQGIEKLKFANVKVISGVLETECKQLNKRFFTYHLRHRPYIVLKWAETADKKIAGPAGKRLLISNEQTNRLVHKWRGEEMAILVGTNTALLDDPELTTRYWSGPSPIRLVVDTDLRLPSSLKLFNGKTRTIIFNKIKHEEKHNLTFYQVTEDVSLVHQVINALYQMKIHSVLVEGGARLLQSFIDEDMWDEIKVICNKQLAIGHGLPAPQIPKELVTESIDVLNDNIKTYSR